MVAVVPVTKAFKVGSSIFAAFAGAADAADAMGRAEEEGYVDSDLKILYKKEVRLT